MNSLIQDEEVEEELPDEGVVASVEVVWRGKGRFDGERFVLDSERKGGRFAHRSGR